MISKYSVFLQSTNQPWVETMKSLLTCVRRAMRWSFLALLLLHVPFILNGLVGGFFWARELVELEGRMVQHYRDNMETARRKE